MKVLRSVFVMIIMSSLFVIPAQAQGGGKYGFLPLITQIDPSRPLELQTRRAFNRMMPQLLAAQRSGAILGFEPDLSAGILKIAYTANGGGAAPFALRGSDDIRAVAALVPHPITASAQHFLAISPIFSLYLYSSCFSTTGLGASSHVIGSLRDTTGRVVANMVGNADGSGYLYSCFDYSGAYTNVTPGYKITFQVYDLSATLLGTFSTTVPHINFTGFNKSTSVIGGTGPKHKAFTIEWSHELLNAADTSLDVIKGGMSLASGSWGKDMGSVPFRGGDYFRIWVTQTSTFKFGNIFYLPAGYCAVGTNYCSMNSFASQPVELSIVHAGTPYNFPGRAGPDGYFSLNLMNGGAPVFVNAGDKLSGTGLVPYNLANLTAVPNFATNVVSGKGPANRYLQIWIKDLTANTFHNVWTHANAAGNYSADFNSLVDIQAGLPYTYEIFYIDPVTGNETDKYIVVGP